LPEARDDLAKLKDRKPSDAERVAKKVSDIAENLEWNRDPRTHHEWKRLDKEELPEKYSFYRKWIGSSGYRMIVTIVDNEVKIVGILPKHDDTYADLSDMGERAEKQDRRDGGSSE